jgi:SAM-dependent methyltransferase
MSETRFSFGKNWSDYVSESLDEERIAIAVAALQELLNLDNLRGQTFLDIGSGSGLHSLAAYRLGADEVISFDYDPDSVRTTEQLRAEAGSPPNWQVLQGSILDEAVVERYRASIVYSWGVLHHTGAMWQAIRNAARMVQPGGLFCIAIYNKVDRWLLGGNSVTWRKIKHYYVNSPQWRKTLLIWSYKAHFYLYKLLRERKSPRAAIHDYTMRGMNWHNDVVDWVGGYPFEYASVDEITAFCEKDLNMVTLKVVPKRGHVCNEFLFRAID